MFTYAKPSKIFQDLPYFILYIIILYLLFLWYSESVHNSEYVQILTKNYQPQTSFMMKSFTDNSLYYRVPFKMVHWISFIYLNREPQLKTGGGQDHGRVWAAFPTKEDTASQQFTENKAGHGKDHEGYQLKNRHRKS